MKKYLLVFLIFLLAVGLCACSMGKEPETVTFSFPEGSALLGVDLTGLTKEAAEKAVTAEIAGYSLKLSVDGIEKTLTAEQIGLACDAERLNACIEAMEQGTTPDPDGILSFNEGKLRALADQYFNHDAVEASVIFDESSKAFVLIPDEQGQHSNPNAIVAALGETILSLAPQAALTDISEILEPVRSAEDPEVTEALAAANKMLEASLTYTFTPEDTEFSHEITPEDVRSFIRIAEDGITPQIDQETLEAYVADLSERYSTEGTTGDFKTTGGGTVGLTVPYDGCYVDETALAEDIAASIREGLQETRAAAYQNSGSRDLPYGGTYIEVDLSAQHLWFYKNGERIVSTDLVSGKVAEEMCTPTGIYSIYKKSTGTYLTGEDYRTYVNFWMPFHYGYGLHDATWRGAFGGDIYLYGGSHGCVNLPYNAAAAIYENASVGTKVILYGGVRSVPPVEQSLSGTTSYDVADDADSFKLNIKPKYSDSKLKLTYKSDNTKVATVSSDGVVTVKGIGTAKITVTAPKFSYYTEASKTVTVKVHSACEEGRHKWGDPVVVTAPTCQPGLEKLSCKKCDHSTERKLAAVDKHTFGKWVTVEEPTCVDEGTKERTCTTCNKEKKTGTIPATGIHTEGKWKTTKEPTCVEEGTRQTKCTVCDTVVQTEKIAPTGEHTPGDWETAQKATCTTDGKKVKKCIHCKEVQQTELIPAGHKPGEWETTQEAACTAEGKKVKKCTVCLEVLEETAIERKSHNYDSGPVCIHCGEPNPDYIAPTGGDDEDEEE